MHLFFEYEDGSSRKMNLPETFEYNEKNVIALASDYVIRSRCTAVTANFGKTKKTWIF